MTQEEIASWELRTGHLTKDDLIRLASSSELRIYENDLPYGAILDIGVGLGCETLYFVEKGNEVIVVDKEDYFLNRIKNLSNNQVEVFKSNLPEGELPQGNYSLIMLSNILHFMHYEDCKKLCKRISSMLLDGGYVIIKAHSSRHPYAQPNHKKNVRFKHFFNSHEVKSLFSKRYFEVIYFSSYQRKFSNAEIALMGLEREATKRKSSFTLIIKKVAVE